jgi:hypothetical protein
MKFLTISTFKDTFYTLPKAEQNKFLESSVQWITDLKKKLGNKFMFYSLPGWGRTVSISEFNTLEEYAQSLQSPSAAAGFNNFESYPVIEADEKMLNDYLKAMKAAK